VTLSGLKSINLKPQNPHQKVVGLTTRGRTNGPRALHQSNLFRKERTQRNECETHPELRRLSEPKSLDEVTHFVVDHLTSRRSLLRRLRDQATGTSPSPFASDFVFIQSEMEFKKSTFRRRPSIARRNRDSSPNGIVS
jgi:hypothetical protein